MKIISEKINLDTFKKFEVIDITASVNKILSKNNINKGIVSVFSKHSTSAIVVNENEKYLLGDLEFMLDNLISDKFSYNHDKIDNNASSHLKAFLLSASETIPVLNKKLDLGTWQSLFFVELDGPRKNRKVDITIIGE